MTFLHTIILGIVEGITEFLPVSSTGHLILTSNILGLSQTAFLKTFEVAIQSGAILAVLYYAYKKITTRPRILLPVIYAFIPTALLGLVFYHQIKTLFDDIRIVAWALIIGGVIMIIVEYLVKNKEEDMPVESLTPRTAVALGLIQCLAFIPGVSRSGATIIGGRLMRLPRTLLVEFSFLLAIPTLGAATGLDLLKTGFSFTPHEWLLLLVGTAVSGIVAYVVMNWLIRFIKTHSFIWFGVYRIVIGILFLLFI